MTETIAFEDRIAEQLRAYAAPAARSPRREAVANAVEAARNVHGGIGGGLRWPTLGRPSMAVAAGAAAVVLAVVGVGFLSSLPNQPALGDPALTPTVTPTPTPDPRSPGPTAEPPTLTAPPFGPAGNGVIAMAKDGDILVADRPGGDTRPLLVGPENDGQPMFSPDGTRLAFLRSTELGSALMIADADGTNVVQLTPETLDANAWSFAPDGRSLVGVALIDGEPDGPDSELGNAPKRVLIRPVDPAAALTVLEIPLWESWMEISESRGPSFRPTNPQEILVVTQLDPGGPRGIHVYDLATGGIRTILEPAGYVHDVAWSPTGEHISYALTDGTSIRARVVAADGSGDRALDNAPGTTRDDQVSRWSNDGTRIVISRVGEAAAQTVVVSTSGDGVPVELACGHATDIECADPWIWSPDDSMLIGPGDGGSLQADPDTGQVTKLDWHERVRIDDPQAWQRLAP